MKLKKNAVLEPAGLLLGTVFAVLALSHNGAAAQDLEASPLDALTTWSPWKAYQQGQSLGNLPAGLTGQIQRRLGGHNMQPQACSSSDCCVNDATMINREVMCILALFL